MSIYICPNCGEPLEKADKTLKCPKGHSFDISKRNYVNLLPPKASIPGDNKLMVQARREFLGADYYLPLANAINNKLCAAETVIDAGCGEGYYTEKLECGHIAAFDISKEALYAAGARHFKSPTELAVAGIFRIPIADAKADTVVSIFAPLCAEEFARVLKADGRVLAAAPGAEHLMELKAILYDEPYPNDEKPQIMDGFELVSTERVKYKFSCRHLPQLFMMTPYAYHTPEEGRKRLENINEAEITADFLIFEYKKL